MYNSGFATDGAFHLKVDTNNAAQIDWDCTRKRPNVVLDDFPLMSGSTPDEHLIEHFLFNDNAASSTVVASTGNNATWEESDGTGRNTSNDTVTGPFQDSGLDTGDTYHVDCATTVYTNAVYKESAYILQFTPQWAYDDAADQTLFIFYVDADDYIQLVYDAGNDRYELRVSWGGTLTTISDSAYTENLSLQQPTTLMWGVNSDNDTLWLAKNGQVVANGTNTGTPSASAAAYVHIGADSDGDGTTSLNADVHLDSFQAFNSDLRTYGAYPTLYEQANDYDQAHSGTTFYWDGSDVSGSNVSIGSVQGTYNSNATTTTSGGIGNNDDYMDTTDDSSSVSFSVTNEDILDFNKGSLSLWFNLQTLAAGDAIFGIGDSDDDDFIQAVFDAGGNIDVTYKAGGTAETITGDIAITTGIWYHLLVTWDDTGSVHCEIDGITNGTDQAIANTWDGGASYTLYFGADYEGSNGCDIWIDEVYITDDNLTPQIWTNFGKELWTPLFREDASDQTPGTGYEVVFLPDGSLLYTQAGDVTSSSEWSWDDEWAGGLSIPVAMHHYLRH